MTLTFRWLVRRDMPSVLAIEADNGAPWKEVDILNALRRGHSIGLVAERDETIVAFMIYQARRHSFEIVHLVVADSAKRGGVARQCVQYLKEKLGTGSRPELTVAVGEINLPAQLFFRTLGFRAISVLRNYESGGRDAYLMRFHLDQPATVVHSNRISRYLDIEA